MDRKIVLALAGAIVALAALVFFSARYLFKDKRAQRRQAALMGSRVEGRETRFVDQAKRRKAISESLKEVDEKKKSLSANLEQTIAQAGLTWSLREFYVASAACGGCGALLIYAASRNFIFAGVWALVGALLIPRWLLSFWRNRRMNKFVEFFPEALDVIIRGVKAGLPVTDCFRVIASDGQEPVRSEFRRMVEAQSVGMTVGEAVERLAERVPVAEASFFAIVVVIQQKTGGNLTEALSNLARVLRDRKKMKGKIKAMSSEAKASAGIIGSLPFLVGGAVSMLNPSYMALLYTTFIGKMVAAGSLLWMLIGIIVMSKMINFDF